MPDMTLRLNPSFVLVVLASLAIGACDDSVSSSAVVSELASAVVSGAGADGVLLCAPTTPQLDACSGLSVGDACTMVRDDRHGSTVAGTCRVAIDGASIACAPTPPSPPQVAVDACADLLEGDACSFEGRRGDMLAGACRLGAESGALACAPSFTPPRAGFDACDGLGEGDVCTVGSREGQIGRAHV